MNEHDELDGINDDLKIISDRAHLAMLAEAANKIVRDSLVRIFSTFLVSIRFGFRNSNTLFKIRTGWQIHFNIWTRRLATSQFLEDRPFPSKCYT